jgi:peptide/nickel transport system substrate-binding protein
MHKFILFIKEFRIYKKKELLDAVASFSKKQFTIFVAILIITILSLIILLSKINSMFLVDVPVSGGTITEGIIGVPTLVNPVVAISDADKDLAALVYSGLMRKTPEGSFIPDLAESFTISEDGTIYTFKIKRNAKFHNGKDVTADDIIFTINKIKDPIIKSPRKLGWAGVSVSKIDDYTVVFTLNSPYISFIDNTTIGILPSSLWENISVNDFNISPLNTKAVGSGPYKIKNVFKNNDGIPEKYELERFNNFTLSKPRIKNINIISYSNERDLVKALTSKSIDQAGGISPLYVGEIKDGNYTINTATLPRIFGLFFNVNNNKNFSDNNIIKAINIAIDRQDIINQVLESYGSIVHNPIPEKIVPNGSEEIYTTQNIDDANMILDKAGWAMGDDGIREKETSSKVNNKVVKQVTKLSFSLTTGDTPELKKTALLIEEQLKKIGIAIEFQKVYETGQLNQLIRARDYEALLFGQLINHESDLYSYWHGSQRTDPGKNIAMYENKKVDNILESIQKTLDINIRTNKYEELSKEFDSDIPAVLIYSPKYIYITSSRLDNIFLSNITVPGDRFSSVYEWSTDTDKVWKIFTK